MGSLLYTPAGGKIAIFLLTMSLLRAVASPSGAADGGLPGAFLRQDHAARAAALGGAGASLADDLSALALNPAGLARLIKPEFSGTHVVLFEDTGHDFASIGLPTRWGALAAGFIRESSGGFERRSTPFDAPVEFSVSQTAFIGAFGAALPLRLSGVRNPRPLEVGLAVKSVRETIDSSAASGQGADVGIILRPDERASLSLFVQNALAPKLTFRSEPVSYPRRIEFSPAYRLPMGPRWSSTFALRIAQLEHGDTTPSGGVELAYHKMGFLRFGMRPSGPSTGIGVRIANTQVDYASFLHELGVSHLVTFSQRFGQTPEELQETIQKGIRKQTKSEAVRLSRAYIQSAEFKLEQDRLTEALQDLEAAALWDPQNPRLLQRIAELESRIETSLNKKIVERTALLGRQQFERGNLLASRQYWKSVLELDEANAEAQRFIGRIDDQLSKDERLKLNSLRREQLEIEALQLVEAAKRQLERGLFREALLQAEKASAMASWHAAIGDFAKNARERFRASIRTRLEEADRHLSGKRFSKALEILESVARDDPQNRDVAGKIAETRQGVQQLLTPEARKENERLYYRAVEHYLKGEYKEAQNLIEQVLRTDPASDWARKLQVKIEAALKINK